MTSTNAVDGPSVPPLPPKSLSSNVSGTCSRYVFKKFKGEIDFVTLPQEQPTNWFIVCVNSRLKMCHAC